MEGRVLHVGSLVPASLFFWLAKASAAWDGGAVRLLAPTNKDSERRSTLFCLFFPLCVFSLSLSECPHPFYTFPSGKEFKLVLRAVLDSVF